MKRLLSLILVTLSFPCLATAPTKPAVRYGSNRAAGHTFTHDGVRLYYEVYGVIKTMIEGMPEAARNTPEGRRQMKPITLLLDEPHIEPAALEAITAPTLVLASDHDIVRDEHTIEIYHHIPNSELAIFPNATHMVVFDEAMRFNATVEQFFRTPFVKKDPIKDTFESAEKMRAAEGKAQ